MGNDLYTIIDIDNEDAEITAEEITTDILPEWNPDIYKIVGGIMKMIAPLM